MALSAAHRRAARALATYIAPQTVFASLAWGRMGTTAPRGRFILKQDFDRKARQLATRPSVVLHKEPKTEEDVWDMFAALRQQITPEDAEKLPADLAAEHDHYIYGTPKRG